MFMMKVDKGKYTTEGAIIMVQQRNIALCIIYSIITCGIYQIYWFMKITDETNELSGNTTLASGGMAFLLTIVTCGIYGWYWAYKMGEKIDIIKGTPNANSGILYVILQFFKLGIVNYCLIQDTLNNAGNYNQSGNMY